MSATNRPHYRQTGYRVRDFVRDEVQMRKLFQDFAASIFAHHRKDFSVSTEMHLKWDAQALNAASEGRIPGMRADIVLQAKDKSRLIVIDTKFSGTTLEEYQGSRTLKAQDLRQIMTYLETISRMSLCQDGVMPEGVLLYPRVDDTPPLDFIIRGFRVALRTIDLSTSDVRQIRSAVEKIPDSLIALGPLDALAA